MRAKITTVATFAMLTLSISSTEYAPPKKKVATSTDGQFRVEAEPPKFRDRYSYQLFERQDFISLHAAEGRSGASGVRVSLFRTADAGRYFEMWTRLSPATTIPTKLQLFTSRGAPVVLLEGKYASEPGEGIPFTVFNQFGRCLTNGIYPATLAPSQARTNATAWRLEGESLQLLDAEGHVALVVTLLDGPQK